MATTKSQRVKLWIIVVVLTFGTLGSFAIIGLSIHNSAIDQANYEKAYEQYLKEQKKQAEANAANSNPLSGYSATSFDASSVTKLDVQVLAQGDGIKVKSSDKINCSYFGWLPDGTIFDSTTKKSKDDAPTSLSLDSVITGWKTGLTGVNVGSTVKLTIPADEAYGSTGSGIITANTPLEFIVVVHSIDNSTS